jgi:hypothetical protein
MSNLHNSINVKDLPSLEQILAGNYLIVENVNGTNKLDFADFVVGPSNTSFYTSIANDIRSISAREIVLSTELDVVSADLSKKVSNLNNTVTSTVSLFSPENLYYSTGELVLNGTTSGVITFVNVGPNVRKSNFNVQMEGLFSNSTGLLIPSDGLDLGYNWWFNYNVLNGSTVVLSISTNGKYINRTVLFTAVLYYNVR